MKWTSTVTNPAEYKNPATAGFKCQSALKCCSFFTWGLLCVTQEAQCPHHSDTTPSQEQHQIPREIQRGTTTASLTITPLSLESQGKRNATWAPSHQASSWWTSWLGKTTAARSPQHCSPFPYLGHSPVCPWAPCSAWTAKNQQCLSGIFKASFLCSPIFLLRRKITAPSMFLRTCCTPNAEGTQKGTGGAVLEELPQQHSLEGIMFLKSSCLTFLSRTFLSYTFIF